MSDETRGKDVTGMDPEEEARLRENLESQFEGAVDEVDRDDVDYVLKKLDGKVDGLGGGALAQLRYMVRQIGLLGRLLKDWWNKEYDAPWKVIAAATASLFYFINPFDLIPDYVLFIGYLDDIIVLRYCVQLIQADLRDYGRAVGVDLGDLGLAPRDEVLET